MGTVTLTVEQLQDLLQAQTSQLEQHFTHQIATLQSNLEATFEEKLQAKFDEAETNVKEFMKESMEEDTPEEESSKKATEDLQFLKDHVIQMEQSVSRIVMGDNLPVPEDEEMDVSIDVHPSPKAKLATPKLNRPFTLQRSKSADSSGSMSAAAPTGNMERMVFECCDRLEEIVETKMQQQGSRGHPRRSQSVDAAGGGGGGPGSLSALRAVQQHMEDLLETKISGLEQFIDSRHAEMEAYYGSANDNLKKTIKETLSKSTPGGASGNGSSTSIGGTSSHSQYGGGQVVQLGGTPLTREELEAALDARISAEDEENPGKPLTLAELEAALDARINDEEENKPLTKDELEAILDARISAEEEQAANSKPLTRDELEAVLDARISAEEEQERRRSKALTKEELEAVLDARITAEEEEEERRMRQTQMPAESTSSSSNSGNKSLHSAMERLIQQQQEWIQIQSSTRHLEQQVQFKLDQMEGGGGQQPNSLSQRVESKLESLEKLMLAAIATSGSGSGANKKKQRASSKKPSKKLSQLINNQQDNNNNSMSDNISASGKPSVMSRSAADDSSLANTTAAASHATPRASNAYADISVDERGMEDDEEKEKQQQQQQQEPDGDHVKSFMSTLSKFKELNKKQEDVRDHRMDVSDDGDDDIDSNASMSVDSSVGGDGGMDEDYKILKILERLEAKLDQLDEKVPDNDPPAHLHPPLASTLSDGGVNRERSTNARHSREVVVNTDSIEASIRAEHSKLKQWMMEQQDEINHSESVQQDTKGGDPFAISPRSPTRSNRSMESSRGSASAATSLIDPKQLQSVQEKLNSIEALVSTNQSFLQENLSPVARELPLVQPLGGTGTIDLERKILSQLNNMDKSVQFKLDEIFAEVQSKQQQNSVLRRDSDWSSGTEPEQSFVVKLVEAQLQEMQEAITTQLKENIPDYGMAKSLISETLEDMRQIVSEVAISEVELLKTQLGVAEEAEQEALHAVLVMREQLEESKEAERRAIYTPQAAPQPSSSGDPASGLWNFGPFGQLIGQQLPPTSSSPGNMNQQNKYQSRKMSIGQQSATSGGFNHSASRGLNYNHPGLSKNRSPKQKLEDWKKEITHLDDKATDLRTMYSQLRGQSKDEWMEQRSQQTRSNAGTATGTLTPPRNKAKMNEMEISVPPIHGNIPPPLAPIPAENNDGEGDWI